jgi:phosphatidylinositol alpha-1,6-mannosyltransferase
LDPVGSLRRAHRWLYFRVLKLLEARVYRGPATIWAMSRQDARELERRFGRPSGSVPVVPHGVNAQAFSSTQRESVRGAQRSRRGLDERRVALIVGNDIVKKGMDTAIRTLRYLPADVVLGVAGSVDDRAIMELAGREGVADRVLPFGRVDDLVELFALTDVVIAPSREEAFNLPVLEAMACGLPVVVSSAAGVSELLTDGRDAVVIADYQDERALANAIGEILGDEGRAAALAEAGLTRARSLTWDQSAATAGDLIEREIRNPRVLVLAADAGRVGGIQRVTRTLVRAVADAHGEERIGVLSVWRGDEPVAGRTLRRGDRPESDGRVGRLRSARFAAASVGAARRWRKRLAIVVAHPHLAPVGLLARLVSGAPYAVWCHGIEVWGPLDRATRLGLRRADRVFAPSAFTARQVERYASLPAGAVLVLPHCVPPEFRPSEGGDAADARVEGRVVTVARLHADHAYKGVDTLIEVWPQVRRAVPAATLVVVGDGPDRGRLERRVEERGIAEAVTFTGRLPDERLMDAYATASLFAMPARHRTGSDAEGEGFGLVYVEAGAYGVPVVAGMGGGADEAVEDGVNGLVVDPTDREAIASAIVQVLTDTGLARRLGEGGRRLAETRFSYENFSAGVADLIDELPVRGLFG